MLPFKQVMENREGMDEDFSKAPISLAEARYIRGDNRAHTWTPRDAIMSVLRQIDSGELDLSAVIVVMRTKPKDEDHDGTVHYRNSSQSSYESVGMLEYAKRRFIEESLGP